MDQASPPPLLSLNDIWHEPGHQVPVCCVCSETIGDEALVRTIRLWAQDVMHDSGEPSRIFNFPSGNILAFNRHMKCLKAKNVQYVTISHVWDAEIGDVQSSRMQRDGIVERIFVSAHAIIQGLEDSGHGRVEICRVWTTMEYVRSSDLRVMLKGYQIATEGEHHVFLPKMFSVWNEEVHRQCSNVWQVEREAGMGQRIVPWQIGQLMEIRERVLVNFGVALATLRSRGCRSSEDFLYALRGITKAREPEKIDRDPGKALVQIAEACLKEGDYSPLMVTPRISRYDQRQQQSEFGFNDVYSFGFGVDTDGSCPAFYKDSIFNRGVSILKLETIGTVDFARTRSHQWGLPPFPIFECYTHWVLHHSGPDVDEFSRAIGARFYNLSDKEVEATLSNPSRRDIIDEELQIRYDMAGSHWNGPRPNERDPWNDTIPDTRRLAGALGLLSTLPDGYTALDFSIRHGGTMHYSAKRFAYRAAMFKRPTEMLGAVSYRLPGLKYFFTRVDGAGIISKDRKVIGRLIYASPACPCRPSEMVEVTIDNLPLFCSD
ncbi:hypothetical protein PGQ11_014917 [Apiospora arundinis]|uniref:Heterokaryon incompatibility domain-containing protein n=1 Tax=Apiospora arundinis TaxID=335852 RepID=A0ABR2HJR1_9PEZI